MSRFEDKESHNIVKSLFKDAEFLKGQQKGSCADYFIEDKFFLEVKMDKSSAKTGNLFVEIANEKDGIRYPSGIELSAKHNYKILYIVPKLPLDLYLIDAEELLRLAREFGKLKKTRPFINGNQEGFFGIGYLLPISFMVNYRVEILESAEEEFV